MLIAEEAEPQPAIGGEAHPIAALAVVVGKRADHPDRTWRAGKGKIAGRTVARRTRYRLDALDRRDAFENLVGRDVLRALQLEILVHRHDFDESARRPRARA